MCSGWSRAAPDGRDDAFVIGAIVLVVLFPKPELRPFVPPLQPLPADERVELERWFDLQPKVDLPLPPEQAKVVIVKFNDYQCPPCRGTYFAYEPIVAKYKDRPQDVNFILKHFPLNSQCNAGVHNVTHPAACDAAAAAVMASQRGTFDKLTRLVLHAPERPDTGDRARRGR